MATPAATVPQPAPLSESQRLVNTFFAPSKTFTDLRRSAKWWAPFLITALISLLFVFVVDQKIGFRKVVENQLNARPKQAERIERMPAADRERVIEKQVTFTKLFSYSYFVIILAWYAIIAGILLASFKFGAGADIKYKTVFALTVYAGLPGLLKTILAIISILAGVSTDSFTFQNPVATNPGYFVDAAASPVLYTLLSSLDVFVIWTLVLAAIGITCISKVKRGTAFGVIFGWFFVLILIGVGFAAAFS